MLSFSLTGCIEDGQNDLQPESDVEPTVEPTGAADFDSLERRINELENETEELKYNNDKLGNRIVELEDNNSELMDSYEQLSSDYDNLTSEINSLYQQLEELENSDNEETELLERIALLEQKIADLEDDVEELMLDKSLLYNKLYILMDINTDEIVFEDDTCISGCSAYTRDIFDMHYYNTESEIGVYGDSIFFGATSTGQTSNRYSSNLWISDGTHIGTYKLSDFSAPRDFTTVDNGVFFLARDGPYGYEVMFSDGTREGTSRVTSDGHNCTTPNYDIYGGSGNTIFLSREIYTNGCSGGHNGERLYRVTALNNGEIEIVDLDEDNLYNVQYQSHIIADGKFFFGSRNYDEDTIGLYVANSQNITSIVEYNDNNYHKSFGSFGSIGDIVYYSYGELGNETLWKSDGTEDGTFQFKSLHTNSSYNVVIAEMYSDPVRDLVYFRAIIVNEDDSRTNHLYISDGTAEGTHPVIESYNNSNHGYDFYHDEFDDRLYCVVEKSSDYGNDFHFYVFDDNSLSFDFLFNETENNFGGDLRLHESYLIRGNIYLIADNDPTGMELWKIDIDSEYIGMLHDVNPGPNQSGIDSLTYSNGKLYFSAYSPSYGGEYWYITV